MIELLKAREALELLGLKECAAVLDSRLDLAASTDCTYAKFLSDLLEAEVAVRRDRYMKARTRLAHLPFQRTLDQFDFAFQPSVDERQIRELATLSFAQEGANVIFLGPPGVGKTHLSVALAIEAIKQGLGAYFVTAHQDRKSVV